MNKKIIFAIILAILAIIGGYYFTQRSTPMGGPSALNEKTLSVTEKAVCGITAEVTEGPYYVSGTKELTNGDLNYTKLSGDFLTISGHVYEGLDNTKPLKNAKVEIWHADNSGSYHPNSNGATTKYTADQIALRGYVMTDSEGKYSFTTIYPGEYSGRTRHIHIKVLADGFKELTTQLILSLSGDDISFDDDTVSQGLPTCHLLSVQGKEVASANFDFRLAR